ncbi:hypothetical protein ACKKBF_B00310 [Auxenochlorella protothecoides x Auxenochlorella symbiontica]
MARLLLSLLCVTVLLTSYQVSSAPAICNANDLRNFNPSLNSGDDSPALKRADASPSTTYIYADKFNAGASLNIKTSVSLGKPLVTGRFLSVKLAAGAVLTLSAQPRFPRGRVISGAGRVVFSGPGPFWILPDWWMGPSSNTDASVALAAARAACASTLCHIIVTGQTRLSSPLTLTPSLLIWGSARSFLTGTTSAPSPDGLILAPGTYATPLTLPYLTGFSGSALTLRGVRGLRAYVPMLSSSAVGLQLATSAAAPAIVDNQLEAFFATGLGHAVWVNARAGDTISATSVYSNFLLRAKSGASSGVYFSGGAPALSNFKVSFSAVDPANTGSTFALVRSGVAAAVSNVVAEVTAWAGGFTAGATLVIGAFNNLNLVMKLSGPISSKVLAFTGAGAKINWDASWNRDSAKALVATRTKNPPIGDMISTNFAVVKLPAALITGTWPKGTTRTFYINHLMANGGMKRILMGPGRLQPAASFIVNPGLVVAGVQDLGSYNLAVTLKNTLGRSITKADVTLPTGKTYDLYFNLMVGVGGIA